MSNSRTISNGRVCIVEFRNGAIHTEAYASRLEAVKTMVGYGTIGSGIWADPAHLAALREVAAEVDARIRQIEPVVMRDYPDSVFRGERR